MIVVDTNVVAYLLIDGDATPAASRIRRLDSNWVAPFLWRSEMRNLLMLYVRRGITTIEDAKIIMNKALEKVIDPELEIDSNKVLDLAHGSGCTAYDCEFVSLAQTLGAKLVTSDKKILGEFPDIAVSMEAFATE